MGHPPDENLPEVVPDQSPQALSHQEAAHRQQVPDGQAPMYPAIYDESPKYATPGLPDYSEHTPVTAMSPNGTIPWEPHSAVDNLSAGDQVPVSEKETKEEPMILGLKRKTFWLLIGVVLIIIAASVGGGVGGGIAAAKSRDGGSPAPAAASSSSTTTGSPTPTSSPSATSSSPPLPSFLFNETTPSPGYAFQGYAEFDYHGNWTPVIRTEGFFDMPFPIVSYVWLPNKTDCCITFCVDTQTAGGWWCQEKRQQQASGKFGRVWIGCGEDAHKQHSCQ